MRLSPHPIVSRWRQKSSGDTLGDAERKTEEMNGNPGAWRYFYSDMWREITCGKIFCFPFFGGLGKIQVSSLHVATWIADGWASTVACNIYGASSLHWFVLSGKANIVCRLK